MATIEKDFIYKDESYRVTFNNPYPESSVRYIFSWTFTLYKKSEVVEGIFKKRVVSQFQNIYEGKCVCPPILHKTSCEFVIEEYLKKVENEERNVMIANIIKKANSEWDGIIK